MLLLLGLVAGFGSAALGIGGGVIIMPVLVLFIGYGIHGAIGTSLAAIIPIASVGLATHYCLESEHIRFIVALFLIGGAIIGARFGVHLAQRLSGNVLQKLFAVLLVFTGLKFTKILDIQ